MLARVDSLCFSALLLVDENGKQAGFSATDVRNTVLSMDVGALSVWAKFGTRGWYVGAAAGLAIVALTAYGLARILLGGGQNKKSVNGLEHLSVPGKGGGYVSGNLF